jgi:phosphoserine phosphatase
MALPESLLGVNNLPSTILSGDELIAQLLEQKPEIAVFDCDGTLWAGDSGADFFYWELERGFVPPDVERHIRQRYDGYLNGLVDELTICGEMIQINRGVPEAKLREAAREMFDQLVKPRIFPEIFELTRRLADEGCELWAVSSTNKWVVEAAVEHFGIPAERVLAATLDVEDGIVTDRLLMVPTDELKQTAIEDVIAWPVDAVFGNSMHDFAMLEKAEVPYVINPNPDLEKKAAELGWSVYKPPTTRG